MSHHAYHGRRILFPIGLGIYLILVGLLFWNRYSLLSQSEDEQIPVATTVTEQSTPPPPVTPAPKVTIPSQSLLKVPFTTQAPLTIWDPLHEEACEEASLMMVYYFRSGKTFGSPQTVDNEIKDMVSWQGDHGYKVDLTAKELVEFAKSYYGMNTGRIITDPTVEEIKTELAAGRPVIVPAAGRLLHNPNFTPPGPIYHMLVIKGYDAAQFITNDPGTRNGEGYRYDYSVLLEANHSWNSLDITLGARQVVVFD